VGAEGRVVSVVARSYGSGWLVRVDMPDDGAAVEARRVVRAAGLRVAGRRSGVQVTFTVPVEEAVSPAGLPPHV
jgi:hypothetical protein